MTFFPGTPPTSRGARRRPRLLGVLAALLLALAPALPSGIGALAASGAPGKGYWFVAGDGGIFSFGDAPFAGSTGSLRLNQPIVGMAPTPTGRGYWFVAADGGIFSFGDAGFYGSTGSLKLNRPIVGMAPTPTGKGYWFVAADGGIFSFGDAGFYGSTGAMKLARPIVGMASSPTGRGYWFVASDGGIFTFGDAGFFGSAAGSSPRSPIVSLAASPSGKGYWTAAADGTVKAFGDAVAKGSMSGKKLSSPIVGLAPTTGGGGYWLVAADGGIFSFGDATFMGSTGNLRLNRAIVGMAALTQKLAGGVAPGGSTPGGGTPGGGTPGRGTPGGGTPGGGTTDTTVPTTTPTTPPPPAFSWGAPGSTAVLENGSDGGGTAFRPWLSGDGRYLVFDSTGSKVMGGTDTTKQRDVYRFDRLTGETKRVSDGPGGVRAHIPNCPTAQPCGSQRATVSADGRSVAFWSNADNLAPNTATNGKANAFLAHFEDDGSIKTTLLSKGALTGGNGDSRRPVVSGDGRYVAFESAATNLSCAVLCSDTNGGDDLFVYEVATGKLTRESVAANGAQGNGASNRPSLSGNGRKLAFQSKSTNLLDSGTTSGATQVFVKDLDTHAVTVVSSGESPSISADGNWVSFDTSANHGGVDTGSDLDVYVKNLVTGVLEQVSVRTGGGQATPGPNGIVGSDSTISADGNLIAFWSESTNLGDNDHNGSNDVFVRDRRAGTTVRVTSTSGVEGDGDSFSPALSMDGRFVALDSKAATLAPGGSAGGQDIFVHVN